MKNNKAPDLYGVSKENLINLSEESQNIVFPYINDMLRDNEKYETLFANISVASYLYKGKGKPLDKVTSYRKISIGSYMAKVVDRIMATITQDISKRNQQGTQYGFTPGYNYLSCGVLRESLVRKRKHEKKKTYILAVDVKNAFSTTNREAQLFELKMLGESEAIWKYSTS